MSRPFPTLEEFEAIRERSSVDDSIVQAALLRVPTAWKLIHKEPGAGALFRRGLLQVIFSVMRYGDGRIWIHVSACGRTGRTQFYLPSYDELKAVKNDFIGDRWAYQVFAPPSQHINQHPCVLHLFALLDGSESALPDFTNGLGTL